MMKILFYPFLILFIGLISQNTNAQWNDTGVGLNTSKDVSIGTASTGYAFYVKKAKPDWQSRFSNSSSGGAEVYVAHGSGFGMYIKGNTLDTKYTLLLRNGSNKNTNIFRNDGSVGLGLRGFVGVGTSSPQEKFHVDGNMLARSTYPQLILQQSNTATNYVQGISTQLNDGTPNWWFGTKNGTEWRVTKGNAYATPLLRIESDGDVSTNGPLDVFTNKGVPLSFNKPSSGWQITTYNIAGERHAYAGLDPNNNFVITKKLGNDIILRGGNVGIENNDPQHTLDVSGTFKSNAANVSSLNVSGLGGSSNLKMLTVNTNGDIGKATIPSGSVWSENSQSIFSNVGNYGKVYFSNFDNTDVSLGLSRQNNSGTWWISHRGPTGAGLNKELEFVHDDPSLGYINPLRIKRDGIVVRNLEIYSPGYDAGFAFKVEDANGSPGLPIFRLDVDNRQQDILRVLESGTVDIEASPEGNAEGAKMTLDGNGSIIFEARNNQNLAIKGANDILIQNSNGNGNIKLTPSDFACVNGRLEIRGSGGCAPDYVFADDYKLRSIEELADFIAKESHLPGVKSAEVFENSGFDVVADSYSFLEKIEELTLYTIAQENKIDLLTEKLEAQQKETEKLQTMLLELLNK